MGFFDSFGGLAEGFALVQVRLPIAINFDFAILKSSLAGTSPLSTKEV